MAPEAPRKRRFVPFLGAATLGFVGGAICGALILSFCYLIGRSGNTPPAQAGTFSMSVVFLGAMYGALLGAIAGAMAYLLVLYLIGFRPAIRPAFISTILGGFCGGLVAPPLAALTGMLGFFAVMFALYLNRDNLQHSETQP